MILPYKSSSNSDLLAAGVCRTETGLRQEMVGKDPFGCCSSARLALSPDNAALMPLPYA